MKEPTLEEVLELVRFSRDDDGKLHVSNVYGDVLISVHGDVGIVQGNVNLSVQGNVDCVHGNVRFVGGNVDRVEGYVRCVDYVRGKILNK